MFVNLFFDKLKICSLGDRKRDIFCQPVRSNDDVSMVYLRRTACLLESWKSSKRSGLTAETFLACTHTTRTLPLLAMHLIEHHGFQYVLLGKFMSDPIEARFGWYRQMNGGNFFMSLRQLLDAEKKIRVLSQLEQRLLLAVDEDERLSLPTTDVVSPRLCDVTWLRQELTSARVDLDSLHDCDTNVIFYVAGYIGRSVSRQMRCVDCKTSLVATSIVTDASQPAADLEIDEQTDKDSRRVLLDMASRGGLAAPTDLCYTMCAIGYLCYKVISEHAEIKKQLMLQVNQRYVFVAAVSQFIQDELDSSLEVSCLVGHALLDKVLVRLFNCLSKNELKRMNSTNIDIGLSDKKVRKLTGRGTSKK